MLAIGTLWLREWTRFGRDRGRMFGAVGQPLLFWLLIGSGFGGAFGSGGGTYLEYLYPGTVMLVLLFTAIFSTITLVEDRQGGFLQAVLVSPISRASLTLGKLLGGATMAAAQALLFLVVAAAAGMPLNPARILHAVGPILLAAFGMTGLGFCIAWRMNSTAGFHAVMNVFLMPLWLLSGALFPRAGVPGWMDLIMTLNPLTYGMSALRQTLCGARMAGLPSLPESVSVLALFAAGTCAAAILSVIRRPSGGGA